MLRTLLAMMGAGRLVVNINVGAQNNYVANTAKVTGYVAGNTDVTFTLTGLVGSASTGSYAFDVDTSWAAGDTVKVVNPGSYIQGCGGAAEAGGGPALRAQRVCSVDNTGGTISGGGGGGGTGQGGSCYENLDSYNNCGQPPINPFSGGAGGTGAGSNGSATGGAGGTTAPCAIGGAGPGYTQTGGTGGSGGALGSSGSGGGAYSGGTCVVSSTGPGSGGAAGAAVNGNSNITWINTGTRNGGIS